MAERLRGQLVEIPGITLHDSGSEHCAIVSFAFEGHDPAKIVAELREQNICIGVSSCDSTLLDSQARKLPVLLRAEPHYYNSDDESDELAAALGDFNSQ